MSIRPSMGYILLSCFLVPSVLTSQAQHDHVALNQILSQLEENTERYTASVPSFTCDEHITSQEVHEGKIKHQTDVGAVFRVRRSTRETGTLEESREVRTIDGRSSAGKKVSMPLSFGGGFSGVLTKFLSADHQQCLSYRQEDSSAGSLAFTFSANEESLENPACRSIQRGTTGKVSVNLAAMQVTHIERTVPFPIGKDPFVLSTAAVDFAPVTLKDTIFWLPITITASTTETPKTNGLRFTATYGGYHLFGATSTIVPVEP